MNLPHPFKSAEALKPDTQGRVALIDRFGKVLTHLPLQTGFDLSYASDGYGYGDGYGLGDGDGLGYGFGDGYGLGDGSGSGFGSGYGEGYGGYGFISNDGSGKGKP